MQIRPVGIAAVTAAMVVAVVVTVLAVPAPVGVSDIAIAHESPGSGGQPTGVALSVGLVVALSVVVSLVGGVAVARRAAGSEFPNRALAALLVVLGGGAIIAALFDDPLFGLLGMSVGGVAATGLRYRREGREIEADAAFGAVLVHRCLEGGLLATAAAANVIFGVAGALVLALHAAGETAAVGGLYGARSRQRGIAAVLAIQATFVFGVVAGGAAVAVLPPAVRVVSLSLSGGVLATVGVHTARHSHGVRHSHGTRVETDDAGSGVVVPPKQVSGDESRDIAK
ncbi:hypothetical protein [Haloprofundus salilacus]|uniref:hypothetical protein n=1 Tax=Haloprofundus salilacus TaxID=2876190 RepID=UPI001CCED029|nr:hypothetical protein [Haloprofundus salilacus]